MTKAQTRDLQRDLNTFFRRMLDTGEYHLRVDGRWGELTRRRVKQAKFYLGYEQRGIDSGVDHRFRVRLRHPTAIRFSSRDMRRRGAVRRSKRRKELKRHNTVANAHPGTTKRNGVWVAKWLALYYDWAKRHGWPGGTTSGWRSPVYSQSLCYRMCRRPSCPGKCAGLASNHVGSVRPKGALDNTFYWIFGNLMRRCPYRPRIFNALGARDPVHFSASGR